VVVEAAMLLLAVLAGGFEMINAFEKKDLPSPLVLSLGATLPPGAEAPGA
jgi:hypothetical protein